MKSSDANEADIAVGTELTKLNGKESSNDPFASNTSPKSPKTEDQSYNGVRSQVPNANIVS